MALIDKLKAIADAIRNKTGYPSELTLEEMPDMIEAIEGTGAATYDMTYILVDENGYEVPATLTDEVVELTADPVTDIRAGTTAVTDEGVVTGEKEIPSYNTTEGFEKIPAGSAMKIRMFSHLCEFTKLQAVVCAFNTDTNDSVAAEKISIDGKVYPVNSTEVIAEVTVDSKNQAIDLAIINESDKPVVIRFFTYKEVY